MGFESATVKQFVGAWVVCRNSGSADAVPLF
jgi:hypothetical protein